MCSTNMGLKRMLGMLNRMVGILGNVDLRRIPECRYCSVLDDHFHDFVYLQ